jgi:hypothetical protein
LSAFAALLTLASSLGCNICIAFAFVLLGLCSFATASAFAFASVLLPLSYATVLFAYALLCVFHRAPGGKSTGVAFAALAIVWVVW